MIYMCVTWIWLCKEKLYLYIFYNKEKYKKEKKVKGLI